MLRKSYWIIALLMVGAAAPAAKAQTTLTFTGDTADAITATDVSFGPTTDALQFTLNDADGFLMNNQITLTTSTDILSNDTITWNFVDYFDDCGFIDCVVGATLTIDDDTPGSTSPAPLALGPSGYESYIYESGTIDISQTPEPSTAILWLTGIGLMILTRKRIVNLMRLDTVTHGSLSPH